MQAITQVRYGAAAFGPHAARVNKINFLTSNRLPELRAATV